jgi:hypothetical protein
MILGINGCGVIHKLGQDNVIPNASNMKEEFQVERPLTKTQILWVIFQRGKQPRKENKGSLRVRSIRSTPF